jgi:hypothetical protein
MLKENSKRTLPYLYQSANKLVTKNTLILATVLLIHSCAVSSNSNKQVALVIEQNKKIDLATNGVVGMTNDGTILEIEKSLINAHERADQVAEPIYNNFLVSAFELTNNLEKTQFKSNEDILNSSRKLQILFNEYIKLNLPSYFIDKHGVIQFVNQKAGKKYLHTDGGTYMLIKNKYLSKRHERLERKGINSFNAYLTYLRTSLIAGHLPSRINKGDYEIVRYEVLDDYQFIIEIHIPTNSQKFMGHDENNKPLYEDGEGVQKITIQGYFDIKTRTKKDESFGTLGINPKGLRFTDFSFRLQDFRKN